MKKLLFTFIMLFTLSATFAQGKHQIKQTNFFVEQATAEFGLNKDQQVELREARRNMVNAYMQSGQSFKAGDITKEESKQINQVASKVYNQKLVDLTGRTYKELKPWLNKMQEEIKKLK